MPKNILGSESEYDPFAQQGAVPGILDGVSNFLFGDSLGGIWNEISGNNAATTAFQRDLEKLGLEQDFAREMQQNEFDYNSPVNQVKMMREAGLNPNLMFGSGSATSSGSAGASPSSGSSAMAATSALGSTVIPGFNQAVSNAIIGRKTDAEVKNINADTNLKHLELGLRPLESEAQRNLWNNESKKFASESHLSDEEARFIADQADFYEETTPERREMMKQELSNLIDTGNQIKAMIKNIGSETKLLDAKTVLTYEQVETERTQQQLNVEMAKTESTKRLLNRMNADLASSGVQLNEAQVEQIYQYVDACEKYTDGLPASQDFKENMLYRLTSDDGSEITQGKLMLEGLLRCNEKQYERELLKRYDMRFHQNAINFTTNPAQFLSPFANFNP